MSRFMAMGDTFALKMSTNLTVSISLPYFLYPTRLIMNRPWWPSILERVSNSSRRSLKDPGLNPAWGHLYGR